MANTANLHCIRKNIGYVCADGFWSSAEILENSLVLAKMQILQNARGAWLRVGVFAIHFEHMGKEHRPRRRGLKARSNASLSLVPLASCCEAGPSNARTATRASALSAVFLMCQEPGIHIINQFTSKAN